MSQVYVKLVCAQSQACYPPVQGAHCKSELNELSIDKAGVCPVSSLLSIRTRSTLQVVLQPREPLGFWQPQTTSGLGQPGVTFIYGLGSLMQCCKLVVVSAAVHGRCAAATDREPIWQCGMLS
jgi:hypothetical protein